MANSINEAVQKFLNEEKAKQTEEEDNNPWPDDEVTRPEPLIPIILVPVQ